MFPRKDESRDAMVLATMVLLGSTVIFTLQTRADCEFFGSLTTLIDTTVKPDSDKLPSCCLIEKELMFVENEGIYDPDVSDLTSPDGRGLSDLLVSFGQFSLSHDNALT